jgi:hypothetical protein
LTEGHCLAIICVTDHRRSSHAPTWRPQPWRIDDIDLHSSRF